ncbi:ATP-grasp domain-containing protein [Agrilactobacillus fermenti]|uniref:ATP-grasp domain-containing protein n=1 Tax=Agrilactobacillus fermenti TaxID=2586909 RepID=UPI003A5BB871
MAFIYPMQTVGIIGGGIKSYHLALTAKQMGFRVALLTSVQEPVLDIVDYPTIGNPNDLQTVLDFVNGLQAVIYQDENIDPQILETIQANNNVPQGTDILSITQDRYLEKVFLDDLNLNVAPYMTVVSSADVANGLASIGYPAIIKPIQKGLSHNRQEVLYRQQDIAQSETYLSGGSAILESWVPVDQEFLIMVVKDQKQKVQLLPIIETFFDGHQLIAALVRPRINAAVAEEIQRIAHVIADKIDYCGVFGISFLKTETDNLYTQRIFPGIHLGADVYQAVLGISQYELQLRALLGWPVPEVHVRTNGAMLVILKAIEEESYTQVKIKPDWQFNYYPLAETPALATPIGQVIVTNEIQTDLINKIKATDLWHI